jgi:hypothetical protein
MDALRFERVEMRQRARLLQCCVVG